MNQLASLVRYDLRKYEEQARLSVVLAIVSILAAIGVAAVMIKLYSPEYMGIPVLPKSKRFIAIMGGLGMAVLASGIGFLIGLSSAGQKRNTKSGLSWMGFFLNAGAMTLAVSLLVVFWLIKFWR